MHDATFEGPRRGGSRMMPDPPTRRCRRRSPREAPVGVRVRLEWDTPPESVSEADVVDISRGGALVDVDGVVPDRGRLRLRLLGTATGRWHDAVVVRTEGVVSRRVPVFVDPCPDDFFLAATLGISFDHLLCGSATG
jgi:hypothetical protein